LATNKTCASSLKKIQPKILSDNAITTTTSTITITTISIHTAMGFISFIPVAPTWSMGHP
jgi:hypothetical protein